MNIKTEKSHIALKKYSVIQQAEKLKPNSVNKTQFTEKPVLMMELPMSRGVACDIIRGLSREKWIQDSSLIKYDDIGNNNQNMW